MISVLTQLELLPSILPLASERLSIISTGNLKSDIARNMSYPAVCRSPCLLFFLSEINTAATTAAAADVQSASVVGFADGHWLDLDDR
jgi:hypothetical protein